MSEKLDHGAAGEISKSHFMFKRILGHGQFGPIWLAEKLPLRELMVVKVMDKCEVYNRRCVDTVLNEQKLLSELMHPFLGNLRYSFQEIDKLYLVTDFMEGGDLSYYLHFKKKKFTER